MPSRKAKKDIDLDDLVDDESPPTIEPYTILGIDKNATDDEVKSAYRKTALKHHPGTRAQFPSLLCTLQVCQQEIAGFIKMACCAYSNYLLRQGSRTS